MKKAAKKLTLSAEVVSTLNAVQMQEINGGDKVSIESCGWICGDSAGCQDSFID